MSPNDSDSEKRTRFESEAVLIRGRIDDVEREQTEAKKRDEEYKQRNIAVQERMANLQRTMVILTSVLAICAIFGGGIAIWQSSAAQKSAEASALSAKVAEAALDSNNDSFQDTLIQMKVQSRAMGRSASAAIDASRVSDGELKQTVAAFRTDQRPYLIIEGPIFVRLPDTFSPSVVNTFKDVGKTPAKASYNINELVVFDGYLLSAREADNNDRRFIEFVQAEFDGLEDKARRIERGAPSNKQDIAPGQSSPAAEVGLTHNLSALELGHIIRGEYLLVSLGLTRYKDSFGTLYETHSCSWYVGVNPQSWRYCPTHNTVQ